MARVCSWAFLITSLCCGIQSTDALGCYSCTNVTSMSMCKGTMTCSSADAICHHEYQTIGNSKIYTLGCSQKADCPSTSPSLVGRSASQDHCISCCNTDNCNRQLCQPHATSAEARAKILAQHNEIRNNVTQDIGVPASNMMKMNYDTSLEADAQAWADRCVREHASHATTSSGENLYLSYGSHPHQPTSEDFVKASQKWWREKFDFTYGGDNSGKTVGHYKQQIWWNSDRLGCAASFCPELTNPGGKAYTNAIFIVCRYEDRGNQRNKNPFTEGSPKCNESDPTYTNLCIPCRKEKTTCIDGGKWNMITCQCDCPPDGTNFKHLSPDCKQQYDCGAISDNSPYCHKWAEHCGDPLFKKHMDDNCLHFCNCK